MKTYVIHVYRRAGIGIYLVLHLSPQIDQTKTISFYKAIPSMLFNYSWIKYLVSKSNIYRSKNYKITSKFGSLKKK